MGLGCGGWDAVAGQFTLPRYRALWRYWRRHPPLPLLMAAYLGLEPAKTSPGDLGDLLGAFGRPGL